jgi:hypothetical protein
MNSFDEPIEEATPREAFGSSDNGQLAVSAGWPPMLMLISSDYSPTSSRLKSEPPHRPLMLVGRLRALNRLHPKVTP